MSRDPSEKEQKFITDLPFDTGRDLAAWMTAIDAQTFAHRNDMIDWLRQQGLTFSRASRLERLHHNGGRPLYEIRPGRSEIAGTVVEIDDNSPSTAQPPMAPAPPEAATVTPKADIKPVAANDGQSLEIVFAKAKGYRPLAELVMRELRRAMPDISVEVRDAVALIGAPQVFAALTATAKDVRMGLDLGDRPFDEAIRQGRLPGTPANLTHLITLNDARKVDTALVALFNDARQRAIG